MKNIILAVVITLLVLGLAAETIYIFKMKPREIKQEKSIATRQNVPHATIVLNRHPDRFDEDYQDYDQWDPFAEMERMQSQMNRLFRSSLSRGMLNQPAGFLAKNAFYEPDVDFQETDTAYVANIDIPGMDKDKISVEVKNNMLTISGERSFEREEKQPGQFYSKERNFGAFSRAIPLPPDAKSDGVVAEYKQGVLAVTIPREQKTAQDMESETKIKVK